MLENLKLLKYFFKSQRKIKRNVIKKTYAYLLNYKILILFYHIGGIKISTSENIEKKHPLNTLKIDIFQIASVIYNSIISSLRANIHSARFKCINMKPNTDLKHRSIEIKANKSFSRAESNSLRCY